MADLWLPGYTRVDLGWTGAVYDEMAHPKLLWHTTEGRTLAGARTAFRQYPPHGCYDPWVDLAEQYVPLNRHAYALAGGENDDEFVIQWEIVGVASESHTWPDWVLERLGRRVAAPIAAAVGVPAQHLRFYRADDGIVLASKTSPIRLSSAAFRAFSGHLGHQHAPTPDQHWDPGGLPIDRILTYTQEDTMPTAAEIRDAVWSAVLTPAGGGAATARRLLEEIRGYGFRTERTEAMVTQLLAAVVSGDLDPDTVLARMDTAVRAATEQAITTIVVPALRTTLAELLDDDNAELADQIVDHLAERLRPAA